MTTPAAPTPGAPAAGTPPADASDPTKAAATPAGEPAKTPAEAEAPKGAKSLLDAVGEPGKEPAKEPAKDDKSLLQGEPAKWHYADGTPGEGEPPEWFKTAKYKTVEEQAKAYTELEKRLGAFSGAPKDGKYEFKLPEGVQGELDADHPLLKQFHGWAAEKQVSNEAYNELLGMFATYEASLQPDMGEVLKRVGEKADERIGAVTQWAKANLQADSFGLVREAMSGPNADVVFKAIEAVIQKTRQPAMPKPGLDVSGPAQEGLEAIKIAHSKRNDKGELMVNVDSLYRAKIDKMYVDYYASNAA